MSPYARTRLIRLSLILGLVIGICLFLAGALRENIVYFKSPSELQHLQASHQKLRLGGLVVSGSIKTVANQHQFQVTNKINTVTVIYKGRLPDLFREGQSVVALGTYNQPQNLFMANQLLAKHDQYYRPQAFPKL